MQMKVMTRYLMVCSQVKVKIGVRFDAKVECGSGFVF